MALVNLHEFIEKTIEDFDASSFVQDRKLPEAFKTYVNTHTGGDKFTFLDYTTVVRSELSIYCPNQWFYIAAYFCKLYPVLQQYKDLVYNSAELPASQKDYKKFFAGLSGNKGNALKILTKGGLSTQDKDLLATFLSDYSWWRGGKGIERNDYYHSPILNSAALVNQSQSYVADICKYLVDNPTAWNILLNEIQGNSIVIQRQTIYENQKIAAFMEECIRIFLQYDPNLSRIRFKKNSLTIGFTGCRIGKILAEHLKVTDPQHITDCNTSIQWQYGSEVYCYFKEHTEPSFKIFKKEFNSAYHDKYEIVEDGSTYKLVELSTVSSAVNVRKMPASGYQIIYYGAPGTGKSFRVKTQIAEINIPEKTNVFRTTFHPDTDYASFVGCYKPTERGGILTQTVWDFNSKTAIDIPVKDINGEPVIDRSITYRYVPQVFVNAYVRAWNLMGKVTASVTSATASPAITMPSFTASSCYVGKCAASTPGVFDCVGVEKLNDEEREALAKVEAFNFPFEGFSSVGDLRSKKAVEVEIVDKPSDEQIDTKSREVTYTRTEVEAEIERLEELKEKRLINFDKYGHNVLGSTIDRLQRILDEMGENDELTRTEAPEKLLGLYVPVENKVYLFKESIGSNMSLLAGTYIHEMFHAYFSAQNYVPEIEEAIVEGATLCFMEMYDPKLAADYHFKVRSMCGSASSYYGFGIELYERRSEDWADDYFHAPRINANDPKVGRFCKCFHNGYPFGKDDELVKLLYTILKSSPATATAEESIITNNEAVVLVVEEINRGNCAQIFGDLFQLLDRKNGWSEYPIKAEEDLRKYLESAKDEDGNDILTNKEGIKNGELCLPPNLFIWATMNTSDQSLFPIDSAFKRRWEMEFEPINYEDAKQFTVKLDDEHSYNWSEVLKGLNNYIKKETTSTNKMLGNRFVQPKNGSVIDAVTFREKVLFFLFNDVFKDNDDFCQTFFEGHEELSFFEDLCESSDITTIIIFVEKICGAKNLEKVDTATPATAEEPEA